MFGFRSPELRAALLAMALATGPAACAYLPENRSSASPGYIELMDRAARADTAELASMRKQADSRFRGEATPDNRLRLAIVLSAPTAALDDVRRSAELLAPIAATPGAREAALQQLARARLAEVELRLALQRENADKSGRLVDLQRQLDEANDKIDELLDIEQSMENGRRREPGEDFKQ